MNKRFFTAILSACVAVSVLNACGNDSNDKKTAAPAAKAKTEAKGTLPNYRYVDIDTVLSKYYLAKDYNEEMARMQSNMENEAKRHQTSINSKMTAMQQKMQNNGYTSEAAVKADQQQLANMQNNAQTAVSNLENNFQETAMKAQKIVTDSIEAFIKEYNSTRGYDAILFKNATLYINPALDITDEVVEGLNARYNKVKK